jgi:hypothetical protein
MRSKNYTVITTIVVITMMLTTTTIGTGTLNILQKASAQNTIGKSSTMASHATTSPTIAVNISSVPNNKNMTMNNGTISSMSNMGMMGSFTPSNVTSSISMFKTMANAIDSSVKVSLSDAAKTAEQAVGANSHAVSSMLRPVNGFLVYTVMVVDPSFVFHKVIVDPGNGKILLNQNLSMLENFMQGMMMMHSGMMGNGMMGNGMMGNGMMGNGMMGNGMMGVIIK